MDALTAVAQIKKIQAALKVLVVLQLTAIYWPKQLDLPPSSDGNPSILYYDYVIAGAGSAGCVIANRLSEDKDIRVLLVEAGGDAPFETMLPGLMGFIPETHEDWNITEEHDTNREVYQENLKLPLTQGKMLGGSSSANHMFYVRGSPHDYQTWADVAGDQSWNYVNILPYFKKSETMEDPAILSSSYRDFHGTTGYLHVTRPTHPEVEEFLGMFGELGHDILLDVNGDHTLGYAEPTFTIAEGVRQSTAYSFLRPIKDRRNLDVLKNTLVTKILFDNKNNAIGVEANAEDYKNVTVMANKEVIITAGALNSPKLLMLSGIGPDEHLKEFGIKTMSNLPVGQNLQDHPVSVVAYKMKKSNKQPPPPNYAEPPLPAATGYVALNKSQDYPTYQAIIYAVPSNSDGALKLGAFNLALPLNIPQAMYEAGKGRDVIFTGVILLHPKSTGTVKLRSTNPEDNPIVSIGEYSDESDLETMASSLEDFDGLRTTSYFKSVDGEFVDLNLEKCKGLTVRSREYWRCHALSTRSTICHYIGTCAMGSVLDERLRVRGVKRLRVADGSAMPKLTSGNTNAPIIMLAEKAADMIKEDNSNKKAV